MDSTAPSASGNAFDVAVIGAGPTGLAAALLSASLGRSTVLVAPPLAQDHRTAALLAGSVSFLEGLGAWERLAGGAAPLRRIRIVDGTARLFRAPEVVFDAHEVGLEAFGYNLANTALTDGLSEAANAQGLRRVVSTAERLTPFEGGVEIATADGAVLTARLVVAADGRRSPTRAAAGIETRDWQYDQAALVANLAHRRPHGDASTEFHTEGGPFTLVPLIGNRSSLVWVGRPAATERLALLDDAAFAAAAERQARSTLGSFALDGPRQVFPLAGMNALRMTGRRIALVGEAAHLLPPIGAQGLNLGLRDVAALAMALGDADPGAPAGLAAYEASRRGDISMRLQAIDGLNRSLLSGLVPVQAMRGLGLFLLDRIPSLRRAVMRQGMGAPPPTRPAMRH